MELYLLHRYCSDWYLLWESWYLLPYVTLLDFGQVSPSSWYLVSYLILCVLIGILFSIGVLSIICCVDMIPFDITPHVLMCFGINHLLFWFFPQSCVDLDFDIIWTTFSLCSFLGLLSVFVQIVSLVVLVSLYMLFY